MVTKQELIDFEKGVVRRFLNKEIKSPVHLSGGDEDEIIEIFKEVRPHDWVFTTHRSHYHTLLKGVPEEWLINEIINSRSIAIMNPEYKMVSSAIVNGITSQAVGCALAIKLKEKINLEKQYTNAPSNVLIVENDWRKSHPHVWCCVGDMAATTGQFMENYWYSVYNNLPITFVIADNGYSTNTRTKSVWGLKEEDKHWWEKEEYKKIKYYRYERIYPHYGTGQRVNFEEGKK